MSSGAQLLPPEDTMDDVLREAMELAARVNRKISRCDPPTSPEDTTTDHKDPSAG